MKKFLFTMLLTAYLFLGININANAFNYTNTDNNLTISEIIINVPSNVNIYEGDEFGINIRTNNEELYNSIKYEITDNKLFINFVDKRILENIDDIDKIKINIQLPKDIKKIRTNSDMLVATIQKNNNIKATNYGKE
jgi:hypothetical protein